MSTLLSLLLLCSRSTFVSAFFSFSFCPFPLTNVFFVSSFFLTSFLRSVCSLIVRFWHEACALLALGRYERPRSHGALSILPIGNYEETTIKMKDVKYSTPLLPFQV
jgi:hypothetical protein